MATSELLPTRPLSKNGPLVPRLGLGLMGASYAYGMPAGDEERLTFLDNAYERGERFWDTGETILIDIIPSLYFKLTVPSGQVR